jgi:Domain of unknown function (DUF4173)
MTTETVTVPAVSERHAPWLLKVVSAVALVGLADWLLFRHHVGIALALFVVALAAAVVLAAPARAQRRDLAIAAAVLTLALLPLIEAVTPLSVLILAAGLVFFAVVAAERAGARLEERATAGAWLLLAGPWQIFIDATRAWETRGGSATTAMNGLLAWVLPVGLGAVFLVLFFAANPLIEAWLSELSLRSSLAQLDIARVLFWLFVLAAVWPFIAITRQRLDEARQYVPGLEPRPAPGEVPPWLFNDRVIVRSLILFNLLFSVQTVTDINYLWRGAALPYGMSYASYAHRGAYPLIATALLAAAFVIAAMRPGSDAERSPLMRSLVFLWVGQNVLLVVSAILRLELYVAVYSLTFLRVAAFVWMLLIAAGLVLIVACIVLGRSNRWLIGANLASLALTLYVCAFVNFPYVIATYNIEHSREMTGSGPILDVGYIVSLGPQAVPVLDRYIAHRGAGADRYVETQLHRLAAAHRNRMGDWRGWRFRGARLRPYLKRHPVVGW